MLHFALYDKNFRKALECGDFFSGLPQEAHVDLARIKIARNVLLENKCWDTGMKAVNAMIAVTLFAAIALVGTGVCPAQQAVTPPTGKAMVEETNMEEEKASWISGSVATDVTNAYIFAGLVQDKDTVIVQPYLNLSFSLYEGKGTIDAVSFELPLWWSIHDINKPRPLNRNSSLKNWFEFDISPGFSFTIAKKLTFTISDYIYTSPGDYFDTSHNLNLAFEYDDADLLGAFALNPHFYFLQELNNHSGLGLQGDTESQYYEVGIEPSYIFGDRLTYPSHGELPDRCWFWHQWLLRPRIWLL